MKKNLLLCVFCLAGLAAFAQQPVQVTTLLRPPYTLQLSDYYASTQEKLVVVLTNRDLNKPVLQVRLRMTIESQTVQVRTRDYSAFPILSLEAGVPLRLSLSDLAPYFNVENLDFAGMSRTEYLMQAKLPEGFYQFCFEAIEVSTNQVASARSCGMAWMSLSDPPLLNVPRKGEAVALKEPQNIIFQWTPRHLNSPNSAFVTEYDFQLVEFWDNALAPEVAFQSAQPLYEVTTRTTTLLYGPSQPLLLPGHRYGWRVRARVQNGVDASDVFRNQGYSEIYWFTFQDVCPPPTGVSAKNGTFGNLEFLWAPNSRHTAYMVTYREKDKNGAVWFDQQSSTTSALVYDVQPGKTYEYRVGGFCKTDQPVMSDVYTITIPARESDNFVNCRIVPDPQISNREPLAVLQPGDVVTAGDFPVKLSTVSGSGSFSGRGYVTVPFLGRAKVQVTFENIQVNTDKQLIAGAVITSYNAKEGSVIDIDEGLDIFKDYQGIVSRLQGMNVDTDRDDLEKVLDRVVENAEKELPAEEVTKVKTNVDELLVAKDAYDKAKKAHDALPDGDPAKEAMEKEMADAKKQFDEVKGRFDGTDKNAVAGEAYTIKFGKMVDMTKYGLDSYRYTGSEKEYEAVSQKGDTYYVPWKAVPLGGFDWVSASPVNLEDVLPEGIVFKSSTGTVESKKTFPRETQVKVYGYGEGETNPVVAYQTRKVDDKDVNVEIGKINVVSYQKLYRRLVVVPVNDEKLPCSVEEISKVVNAIYNPTLVEWHVEVKPPLISLYDLDHNGLQDNIAEVKYLYTTEMKRIINDFIARETMDPETHYIFVVAETEHKKFIGYNPYKKQVGFVCMNLRHRTDGARFSRTIAHELGHGAFRLYHTSYERGIKEGSTNNLMDVSVEGAELDKVQWDLIHNPPFLLSLFDESYESLPIGDEEDNRTEGDVFTDRVYTILDKYNKNLESNAGKVTDLDECFVGYEEQIGGLLNVIDDIISHPVALEVFVKAVQDQVLNLSDDSELKNAVCAALKKRLEEFNLLVIYNDVQYKDGEAIYVTDAEDEIKLSVVSDEPLISLVAKNVTWDGAEGTGTSAVVDMEDTAPTERTVTVTSKSVKTKVTIKPSYIKLTADKFFAPSEENLDLSYDVTSGKTGEWKYAKLEVFKTGESVPVYVDNTVAAKGKGVKISWDGKMNAGSAKDTYISIYGSPYKVKLTVSMDEQFSQSFSDEKQVAVEVESITMTPNGAFSLVKPNRAAKEILQDVEATVKIRTKKGNGVTTSLPVTLQWRYEDPDDAANDVKKIIDRNGPEGNDNTSIADGGRVAGWQTISGYTPEPLPTKMTMFAGWTGENKGKSKLRFSSSVIAGDNYIIVVEVIDQTGKVFKSGRTGIWTVRKTVTIEKAYEMAGAPNIARVMSKANIDPAFSGDGCTDYTAGVTVTRIPVKEFVMDILLPSPDQLPTEEELKLFRSTNPLEASAGEDLLRKKARRWYNDNQIYFDAQLDKFAAQNGIGKYSTIGVQYIHPKHDGRDATGKTNYYPAGLTFNLGTSSSPRYFDVDGDWDEVQGVELQGSETAWFPLNAASSGGDRRLQIVGRHEMGHRSDHVPFSYPSAGDHATEGLMSWSGGMTPTNPVGNPEFSADSINKLRGRKR